jgi:hypothetical protein
MVRSTSINDNRSMATPTPGTWEGQPTRPPSGESNPRSLPSNGRDSVTRSHVREGRDGYASGRGHGRSDSEATGVASSGGYPETTQSGPPPRRHDYDLQAMETTPGSPRAITRNPIPAPSVVVRSEFPTINRSRQQQTLTCLVTVEVADNKWRPDPEDLGMLNPTPQMRVEEAFSPPRPPSPPRNTQPRFYPYEAPGVLEEMTETLRNKVDHWHGLEFNR